MGQKVNPIGFRTGVMIGWKSCWYASKKDFAKTMSFKERDRKHVECPHCNSKQVRQVVTAVSVKTSSKS